MATVLIADDTRTDAELIASVVRSLGHTAVTVADGEQCLASIPATQPHLVILDVVMPHLDGFGTCRRLRKDPATAHIPVLLVSTKNEDTDRFWAEKQGASAYLTKPFSPDILSATVQKLLPTA